MSAALALDSFNYRYPRSNALQREGSHQSCSNFSQAFHHSSISLVPSKHKGTDMEIPKGRNGRTLGDRVPIVDLNERELAATVSYALRADYGHLASSHKEIARDAGAGSPKSAENWMAGQNAPSLLYGLRLMAKSPTLRKEIMRLCALEQELSPEFQEQFANFMRMVGK